MYETSEFRKGLKVEVDGQPYIMVENQFVKPGKGQAFCRVKLKNLFSGNVIDRTYKSGEKIAPADVVETEMNFLYAEGERYHFMDNSSYEQYEMTKEQLGDAWKFIREEMACSVTLYQGQPVSVTLPNFSVMQITYCEPGLKGDTATNTLKPATIESGAEVYVPLFVNQDEKIKIDTRTGEYVERVK